MLVRNKTLGKQHAQTVIVQLDLLFYCEVTDIKPTLHSDVILDML